MALSSHLKINLRQKYIHVTMNVKNSINWLTNKIQDDHDVQCLIVLARQMKQTTSFYVMVSHMYRRAKFQNEYYEEQHANGPFTLAKNNHYCLLVNTSLTPKRRWKV